eukprot:scaffold2824_cov372-Prasinococcus_capsulatus_cf.AAC.5
MGKGGSVPAGNHTWGDLRARGNDHVRPESAPSHLRAAKAPRNAIGSIGAPSPPPRADHGRPTPPVVDTGALPSPAGPAGQVLSCLGTLRMGPRVGP